MKKLLTNLIALLLSFAMIFSFTACGPENNKQISELMSGGIAKLLDEEYINLNLNVSIAEKDTTYYGETETIPCLTETTTTSVKVNLRNTNGLFDSISETTETTVYTFETGNPITEVEKFGSYDIGNNGVRYDVVDDERVYDLPYTQEKTSIFSDLDSIGLSKVDITKLSKALFGILSQGETVKQDKNGYEIKGALDVAALVKDFKDYVDENGDKTLGQVIVETSGKSQADIENLIDDTFVSGLTVTQAIAKLDTLLSTVFKKDISIKKIIDKNQEYSGLTTAEIVNYVKILLTQTQADESIIAELTAPTEGQTLYEYVLDKVGGLSVDNIIQSTQAEGDEPITLANLAPSIKAVLFGAGEENPALKVIDVVDMLINRLGLGENYASFKAGYIFTSTKISYTVNLDKDGKITNVALNVDLDISRTDGTEVEKLIYGKLNLSVSITYGAVQGVTFAMPSEVSTIN